MPDNVSFKAFLATGVLGKLSPESNLSDVAKLLGPPQDWLIDDSSNGIPLYWGYHNPSGTSGPALEISFGTIPPHPINWFQFEQARCFDQEVHFFSHDIAVVMDGVTGETKPSELIAYGVWDPRDTRIYLSTDCEQLVVGAEQVAVYYMLERDEIDRMDELRRRSLLEAFGRDRLFAALDSKFVLNSIYSFPARTGNDPVAGLKMKICSGEQYLQSLRG